MTEEQDRYQRAAAAAGGALGGLVIGGPVGAIAGAVLGPLLEPFARHVWDELHGDVQQRQGETLAAAAEVLGGDVEELERLVLTSDTTRLQTGMALSAAARTAWPPKVIALGRALAAELMAADDTRIDTEPFITGALTDIEFPQASLLELLVRRRPVAGVATWPDVKLTAELYERTVYMPDGAWTPHPRLWSEGQIGVARPTLRPILPSLLGTLQRHGLAVRREEAEGDIENAVGRLQEIWESSTTPEARAAGPLPEFRLLAGVAPIAIWEPTPLGDEVVIVLLEAGAEFAKPSEPNGQ